MAYKQILVLVISAWLVAGQRPSFAGTKPIGYPDVVTPADLLGNKFGDDTPLPVEAKGDRALVERLSKLPIDQQPFWFINWKAVEAAQKNPQTFPQKENSFIDRFPGGAQSQATNSQSNPPNSQSNSGSNSNGLASKFGETNNGATGNIGSNGNFQPSGNIPSSNNVGSNGNYPSTFINNRPGQQGYRHAYIKYL